MNNAKKQAYRFLKQFGIEKLNVDSLSHAIEQQGYSIVEYSRVSNSDDIEQLLNALGLKALSLSTGAFTYADGNFRIVFIQEGLSDDERLILLAHEEGHIFCGHLNSLSGICGEAVTNEHEANTFAHYLLNGNLLRSLKLYASAHKLSVSLLSAAFVLAISATVAICISLPTESRGDYCITSSGQKYHLPDCPTVAGRKIIYGSDEEFKELGKQPCSVCID